MTWDEISTASTLPHGAAAGTGKCLLPNDICLNIVNLDLADAVKSIYETYDVVPAIQKATEVKKLTKQYIQSITGTGLNPNLVDWNKANAFIIAADEHDAKP